MENKDFHSFISFLERNISQLKLNLDKEEIRRKNLKKQAMQHVADICPEEYKRILGNSYPLFNPEIKHVDNMFSGQDKFSEKILGYSSKVEKCSVESDEDGFKRIWEVSGQVGDVNIFIECVSAVREKLDEAEQEEELIDIRKIEISPHSEAFEELEQHLTQSNSLPTLVPSLCMHQRMLEDRTSVETSLTELNNVRFRTENDSLLITVDVDADDESSGHEVRMDWKLKHSTRAGRFIHDVAVLAANEVLEKFENHEIYPILVGEEPLTDGKEVLLFVRKLLEEN